MISPYPPLFSHCPFSTQCSVFLSKFQLEPVIPLLSVVSIWFKVKALSVAMWSFIISPHAASLTSFHYFPPCLLCPSGSGALKSSSETPAVLLIQGLCMSSFHYLEGLSSGCLWCLLPHFTQLFTQMALLRGFPDHMTVVSTHPLCIPFFTALFSIWPVLLFCVHEGKHFYAFHSLMYSLHLEVLALW